MTFYEKAQSVDKDWMKLLRTILRMYISIFSSKCYIQVDIVFMLVFDVNIVPEESLLGAVGATKEWQRVAVTPLMEWLIIAPCPSTLDTGAI